MVHEASIDPKFIPPTRLRKASWESPNEGVHEKVNFDDTIWGFDLAGGIHYNTPLRITRVKDDSRAQKAGIKKGDKLNKINDIPTETLTLQQAHDMIIESGVHIRLNVTAPEDTETTYWCWEDQPEYIEDDESKRPKQPKKKLFTRKTIARWDLEFPWVQLEKYIYKESNCHMVSSKFVSKNANKLLPIKRTLYYQPVTLKHTVVVPIEDETIKEEEQPSGEAQ